MNTTATIKHTQPGSVLVLSLILLLVLTVMAVAEMSINSAQSHVATNSADEQIAFQTAEGALNEATNKLLARIYPTTSFLANANGLYLFNKDNAPIWTTVNWSSANDVIFGFQGSSHSQSGYIIEQLPSIIQLGQNMNYPAQVYRITARGVGASGNAAVILQSTVQIQQ